MYLKAGFTQSNWASLRVKHKDEYIRVIQAHHFLLNSDAPEE